MLSCRDRSLIVSNMASPNGGRLTTPPHPRSRSRQHASVSCGGWGLRGASGGSFRSPQALPMRRAPPSTSDSTLSLVGCGGQGLLSRTIRLCRPCLYRFPVVAGLRQQAMMLGLPPLLAGFRDTLKAVESIRLFQNDC